MRNHIVAAIFLSTVAYVAARDLKPGTDVYDTLVLWTVLGICSFFAVGRIILAVKDSLAEDEKEAAKSDDPEDGIRP